MWAHTHPEKCVQRLTPTGSVRRAPAARACASCRASVYSLRTRKFYSTLHFRYRIHLLESVPPSGSLGLYSAKVNPTGTEFTRPISTVLKRKPLRDRGKPDGFEPKTPSLVACVIRLKKTESWAGANTGFGAMAARESRGEGRSSWPAAAVSSPDRWSSRRSSRAACRDLNGAG